MKKFYFGPASAKPEGNEPFWMPWGAMGWLWRLLVFLALLFLLLLLLSLFKQKSAAGRSVRSDVPQHIINPDSPDPDRVPVDTIVNFPHDIQNPGRNLPQPGDNDLPPFDDDDIVSNDGQRIVGDRLNVILNSTADDSVFNQWADEFKALYPDSAYRVVYYDALTKLLQIQVPADKRDQVMHDLPNQITDISFKVFPEGLMGALQEDRPNDPVFQEPATAWYFDVVQAYDAWTITKGSPDIVVAICDSYFDLQHDDLNSTRITKPYSVVRRTGNVAPATGADETSFMHGSMVASQALGTMDNGRGTAGIAPQCSFMPVSLGHKITSIIILQGLLYAIYQGADVVNLSVGNLYDPSVRQLSPEQQINLSRQICLEEQAVWDYVAGLADERNVTIVWAAGNEDLFTALDASKRGNACIKVSAVDRDLRKADFSNYGNFPEYDVEESTISAPGVDILGAKPFNTYDIGPGTSFAAPIVTGAVALMKSLDPDLTTPEIISILQLTGKPVKDSPTIGNLLQIKDALMEVKDNMVSFSDIMQDHDKLIGLWMSTGLNDITIDNEPTGEKCRNYYKVTSTSRGRSTAYLTDTQKDYTAPFTIEWKQDRIILTETSNLSNPNDDRRSFIAGTIVLTAGQHAHELKCVNTFNTGTGQESYFLRKVSHRPANEPN